MRLATNGPVLLRFLAILILPGCASKGSQLAKVDKAEFGFQGLAQSRGFFGVSSSTNVDALAGPQAELQRVSAASQLNGLEKPVTLHVKSDQGPPIEPSSITYE